jgi:MFS family permease
VQQLGQESVQVIELMRKLRDRADVSMRDTFRSLRHYNYRVWALGALVSNIGTWMQRTAQDWIVLTQLTHKSATAVGIVMSLQLGPQLLLLPYTGLAADRMDRRRLLLVTQASMGALALGLGVLTLASCIRRAARRAPRASSCRGCATSGAGRTW